MTVEQTDREVVCRHTDRMVGYIATCSRCKQVREYDNPDSNKPPKLLKRGRDPLTGRQTMVNPPPLNTGRAGARLDLPETATTNVQHVPEETETSRHISMKPGTWGKMTPGQKARWYDEHWPEFEADVEKLGLPAAQTKWQIADGTYRGILRRHVNAKVMPEPRGVPPRPKRMTAATMHVYYAKNQKAILADLEKLGLVEMRKKWHMPGSTWNSLKRRWPVGPESAPASLEQEVKAAPEPTPEPLEQEEEYLVPVGARMELRNQGMTGIRRLYPL